MDGKKVREAIEFLQRQIATLEAQKDWDEYGQPLYNETLDETIEYYDLAVAALEKQLSKKVEYEGGFSNNGFARYRMAKCPTCDRWYSNNDEVVYCSNCGQRLDWSEDRKVKEWND